VTKRSLQKRAEQQGATVIARGKKNPTQTINPTANAKQGSNVSQAASLMC